MGSFQYVDYQGDRISICELARRVNCDHRYLKRRIDAGYTVEQAIQAAQGKKDGRGRSLNPAKLTPSEVLGIYTRLFNKEVTQAEISREYGISASAVSNLWTGTRWEWLTAPLRFELEQKPDYKRLSNG